MPDNASSATITVTLKDASDVGTPGKLVALTQGDGHSTITGPNPPVTDVNGQIQFLGDCDHALAGQTVDLPEVQP